MSSTADTRSGSRHTLCLAAALLAIAGAARRSDLAAQPPPPVPDVLARHIPLHPMRDEPVTFRAQAAATKITLSYELFTLTVQRSGALTSTSAGPVVQLKTCPGSGGTLTCEHIMTTAFPDASLVRFDAIAESSSGAVGRESYFFAAGSYPLPDAPIPVRQKTATVAAGLDVIFLPTTDLSIAELRKALDGIIRDVYFSNAPIELARGLYNFYYSPHGGNYRDEQFTDPVNMALLEATGDAIVFLHRARLRDMRLGKRISSEVAIQEKSLIHETGHVLFGLQDEYLLRFDVRPAEMRAQPMGGEERVRKRGARTGLFGERLLAAAHEEGSVLENRPSWERRLYNEQSSEAQEFRFPRSVRAPAAMAARQVPRRSLFHLS